MRAFFVNETGDIQGDGTQYRVVSQGAGDFQCGDYPIDAVEPAAEWLGVGMRAEQQCRPRLRRTADDIADTVEGRVEAGIGHALTQPVPGGDVFRRQAGADYAVSDVAETAQGGQVGEQALAVDGRVGEGKLGHD